MPRLLSVKIQQQRDQRKTQDGCKRTTTMEAVGIGPRVTSESRSERECRCLDVRCRMKNRARAGSWMYCADEMRRDFLRRSTCAVMGKVDSDDELKLAKNFVSCLRRRQRWRSDGVFSPLNRHVLALRVTSSAISAAVIPRFYLGGLSLPFSLSRYLHTGLLDAVATDMECTNTPAAKAYHISSHSYAE